VDAGDRDDAWKDLTTPLAARCRQFAEGEVEARSFAIAALREALEEAAILPVVDDRLDADRALVLRTALKAERTETESRFAHILREHGLVLDAARLEALGRWITPTAEPKRFDTRFYLLASPPNQRGAHDDYETTRSFWATPKELLQRWERGEIVLAPPTAWTIGLFFGAHHVDAAFAIARRQSLAPVEPSFTNDGRDVVLTLPGDPLHPVATDAPQDPDAPTRFVLENGRFVPKRVAK
jgi:hypothetical protein